HRSLSEKATLTDTDHDAEGELHAREEAAPAPEQADDADDSEQAGVLLDRIEEVLQLGLRVTGKEAEDGRERLHPCARRLRGIAENREQPEDQREHADK